MSEFFSLSLLSLAQCATARIRESGRTARLALQVAERDGNEEDVYEARLLVARSRVLTGSDEAIEDLRELVRQADERSVDVHRVQSRIFLAQSLIDESPVEAHALCAEARTLLVEQPGEWLTAELERVEYLISHAPIHVDEYGRLVIDTRVSWPTIKAAREAAERYIYDRAITHTAGNASAAGRLIGESRYQMHHLGRILRGEAPRPSRSKAADAAVRKPKRRRSRIVYS
jgi:hypothetical protein